MISCQITKEKIECVDRQLSVISPDIISSCKTSAYDRMKKCIKNNEPLPSWAYNSLKQMVNSPKKHKKAKKINAGINKLRKKGLITDSEEIVNKIFGVVS